MMIKRNWFFRLFTRYGYRSACNKKMVFKSERGFCGTGINGRMMACTFDLKDTISCKLCTRTEEFKEEFKKRNGEV